MRLEIILDIRLNFEKALEGILRIDCKYNLKSIDLLK